MATAAHIFTRGKEEPMRCDECGTKLRAWITCPKCDTVAGTVLAFVLVAILVVVIAVAG